MASSSSNGSGHVSSTGPWQANGQGQEAIVDLDIDVELGEIEKEENELWDSERASRLRIAGPSFLELQVLKETCSQDAAKVASMFGRPFGANAAARRFLKISQENIATSLQPGMSYDILSAEFSVAKHLVLQERNNLPDLYGRPGVYTCQCFAMTYLMPHGCQHKKKLLHKTGLLATQCPHCSLCLRCKKLLGCT